MRGRLPSLKTMTYFKNLTKKVWQLALHVAVTALFLSASYVASDMLQDGWLYQAFPNVIAVVVILMFVLTVAAAVILFAQIFISLVDLIAAFAGRNIPTTNTYTLNPKGKPHVCR